MRKDSRSSITRTLSGASYGLVVSGGRRRFWMIPLFAVLVSGVVYAWLPQQASPELALHAKLDELSRSNERLTQEAKQQSMSLEHEHATREALERQLAAQGEELKKARKDLSFYRENSVRQGQ